MAFAAVLTLACSLQLTLTSSSHCVAGCYQHQSCSLRRLPETFSTNCITRVSPLSKISPNIKTHTHLLFLDTRREPAPHLRKRPVFKRHKIYQRATHLPSTRWYQRKDRPDWGRVWITGFLLCLQPEVCSTHASWKRLWNCLFG